MEQLVVSAPNAGSEVILPSGERAQVAGIALHSEKAASQSGEMARNAGSLSLSGLPDKVCIVRDGAGFAYFLDEWIGNLVVVRIRGKLAFLTYSEYEQLVGTRT